MAREEIRKEEELNAKKIISRAIKGPLARKAGESFPWEFIVLELNVPGLTSTGSRDRAVENGWIEEKGEEVILTQGGIDAVS
jgi:hypothetical protein